MVPPPVTTAPKAGALERADIQGLIIRGYQGLPCAVLLLLDFTDSRGFCEWLGAMANVVANGESDDNRDTAVHVALTREGVTLTGVDPERAGFPRPFTEGMDDDVRARALGDIGDNAPHNWRWGGSGGRTNKALLLLYARDFSLLDQLEGRYVTLARGHRGELAQRLPCGEMTGEREHFGFRDGIGQPIIAGLAREGNPHNVIEAGEFILGYRDEFQLIPPSPTVTATSDTAEHLAPAVDDPSLRDLGKNGTFLVVRQIEQLVTDFWQSITTLVTQTEGSASAAACIRLASKMVGRWPGGAPMVLAPDADDPALAKEDRFGYRELDTDGQRCPIGAHVRRSNPRDALPGTRADALQVARRHRILRRGRSYGHPLVASLLPEALREAPRDDTERGLYFICCNTDIERQFEFVQQTWLNNPKFGGLENDPDPMVVPHLQGEADFKVPATPVRERYAGLPAFVRLHGGAYFFLPGISALRYFGALAMAGPPTSGANQ